jgi:CHAD domain-containing protein
VQPTTTDRGAGDDARVVQDRVSELVDRMGVHGAAVRAGRSGGVHSMRVTLRRLRSVLGTFAPLYDESTVASLRAELKWVAGELAAARDVEVVRERLEGLVVTPEQREVAARIDAELAIAESAEIERSLTAMDSDRYAQLLGDLAAFVKDPPRPKAGRSDAELVKQRVLRDWKRLRKRVRRAEGTQDDDARREALHEVRKAAKRLRYAAETLEPTHGDNAARLRRRAKRLQTELGELQDAVVARETLRALADMPGRNVDDAFVLGTLHIDEEPRWIEAEERYGGAWARLSRKKLRTWLVSSPAPRSGVPAPS